MTTYPSSSSMEMKTYYGYFTNKPNEHGRCRGRTVRGAARDFANGHDIKWIKPVSCTNGVWKFKTMRRGEFIIRLDEQL
jgi:hypothetical protein